MKKNFKNFDEKFSDLNDIAIDSIKYNKFKKNLDITILPKKILPKENLSNFKCFIEEQLPFLCNISINVLYKEFNMDLDKIIQSYWNNILYEVRLKNPSTVVWLNNCNKKIEDNKLIIIVNDSLGLENLLDKECHKLIEEIIRKDFNINIKVSFKSNNNNNDFYNEKYWEEKDNETTNLVNKMVSIENTTSSNANAQNNSNNSSSVVIGKKISGDIVSLSNPLEEGATVCFKGEIFDKDTRELKSGKFLIALAVTDFTSSISVKIFCKKNEFKEIDKSLNCGEFYKFRGNVRYDTFEKELIIFAKDINTMNKTLRQDNSKHKRIELHAHTKMSSMDGICTASDLIKRASDWGHKAIAITDHGVVQSFPEALDASRKCGIKVIYGMEGYIVNDTSSIVHNIKNDILDQTFIVFDIETTGLSYKHDKITEIGAIKVKNGEIIDEFSALINPKVKIPKKIIELTGITDEMVSDKPTINTILPSFMDFVGDNPLVAHNASFDISFIKENCKKFNMKFSNTIIDTLSLSKLLIPKLKRYKLNHLAKHFNIELKNHHRAVDDAKATAEIFINLLSILRDRKIDKLSEINNLASKNRDFTKLDSFHINILVKNYIGLKNLYKIVTQSHLRTFYKKPRILKTMLSAHREGLIIGTACEAGELYRGLMKNLSNSEIEKIINFYDFLEVQPIENNKFMIEKGLVKDINDLKEINKKIIELGKKYDKPVIATGDVHFIDPHESIVREILMSGQGYSDASNQPPIYFKTTEEMLSDFDYIDKSTAYEIVVSNPNILAESVEEIIPIPQETYPPKIEGAEEDLRNMCYKKANDIYGDPLPKVVKERLDKELNSIIKNGYAVMYIIAHKLVTKSLEDGYLVGSRGSVGSSFVATMSDITEVNPLPPHYVCKNCNHSEFILDGSIGSGADLPDKACEICGNAYSKDGHDIPFEVFLGFEGDKEPDIDLNFAGEYQAIAHKYTEELFGKGYVFRAGTIGTLADKSGFGFAKKYYEEKNIPVNSKELVRLSTACTGIKKTTGQHPGGIMVVPDYKEIHDFTPVQYPANDKSSGVITTHFDYHAISGRLLKLDILGHDVPTIIKMLEELTGVDSQTIRLDDPETIKIFTSSESLKIKEENFEVDVGSLGIPEFGTKFVRQMLLDTMPTTFAELVRISGLSHGTDVWINNAQELVRQGVAELKDVISTRDDIMNYLIYKGLPPKEAFTIMERVRKGKGLTSENEEMMKINNVPKWYIESCKKIKYMFPKAHAVAYVMMSFRIAYFKVHHPLAFYATYFSTKVDDFDAELVCMGKDAVLDKIKELNDSSINLTQKEKDLITVLEVVYEAYCRGISFKPVNLYESDSDRFKIKNNSILPPLRALQGVGENAAKRIVEERGKNSFLSIEDIRLRTRITKSVIETLLSHGCLEGLPEENQLKLF